MDEEGEDVILQDVVGTVNAPLDPFAEEPSSSFAESDNEAIVAGYDEYQHAVAQRLNSVDAAGGGY